MRTIEIADAVLRANTSGQFWFGMQLVGEGAAVEFFAKIGNSRYIAYGTWESADVYAVLHAPMQTDFDVIAGLLDDGYMPAHGVMEF